MVVLIEGGAIELECFLDCVSVIFNDKTDPTDTMKQKFYWQHTLKIMALQGLNVEDG